ncbi:MAG: leucine-rich repeat protein [Culicoidibacterales bacterium]
MVPILNRSHLFLVSLVTILLSFEVSKKRLVKIGYAAFSGNHLTTLELPKSVVAIGKRAFYQNQLQAFEIPETIKIEDNLFAGNLVNE